MISNDSTATIAKRSGAALFKAASVALSLALALAFSPSIAAGQERTPFTAEEPAFGGTIFGQSGGSFRYFTIDYPGAGALIILTLDVNESRGRMGFLIGFNVYGPTGQITRGEPIDGNLSSTRARASFSHQTPGEYLVQLFNYIPATAIQYTISVEGLDPEAPISVSGSEDSPSAPLLQAGGLLPAGTLTGDSAGAYRFYLLDYAGGTELAATLTYSPPPPFANQAIGLHLYDGETLVATSQPTRLSSTTVTHRLTFSGTAGTPLLLQLHNYFPKHHIAFSIDLTGLGSPPIAISGNTTPATAFVLGAASSSLTGTVAGSRGGSFVFFLLQHPGTSRKITITVTTSADHRVVDGRLGLNVYQGSTLVQQGKAGRDNQSRQVASATLEPSTATTYGIQLYNYNDALPLDYRLNALGF